LEKQEPNLSSSLEVLRGVGPSLAKALERLGLYRVEDLLFLLPIRYEDRTKLYRLGALQKGMRCLISGEVLLAKTVYRGRRILLVRLGDGTGQIELRFFYFSRQQEAQFKLNHIVTCYGDVRSGAAGLEMVHPEYRILAPGEKPSVSNALTPIYPLTEGIQQGRLRNLVRQALNIMQSKPPDDFLRQESMSDLSSPSLTDALNLLHNPTAEVDLKSMEEGRHPCQVRLAFEELLAHYMSLRHLRNLASKENSIALKGDSSLQRKFLAALPYKLTDAQNRVISEISTDLKEPHPMMRLVQGDVGSGKTVVAAAACTQAISSGVQVAVMAPTELLAEQHWREFNSWFAQYEIALTWVSGSQKQSERRRSLEEIQSGHAQIIIGTHALFQDAVAFSNLGLIVIDEQHRFGVHQRVALRNKGTIGLHPHQLVMTATPIPRTLAMAAYADLDTSVIDELPPGRQPISTIALPEKRRPEVISRVRESSAKGQQAYWVCPLIDESDTLDYQAAEASHKMLSETLDDLEVGLVHGRMRITERDKTMQAFKDGEIDVLVATTVIEVGVDVPKATLMIIENAERMGLSQLHQLRGRVGRGNEQSHCVMLYKGPLGTLAKSRLSVLRETNDGFVIAQRDLELRGPGELLGTRQTGLPAYRIANLLRDANLMPAVQAAATKIQAEYPDAERGIASRWLGDAHNYGKV
tara:strand:- start:3636 stop:5720 length:2085 start_codon:yes stop_codon:yes gene_type:complete